jgi:hypothetical protein
LAAELIVDWVFEGLVTLELRQWHFHGENRFNPAVSAKADGIERAKRLIYARHGKRRLTITFEEPHEVEEIEAEIHPSITRERLDRNLGMEVIHVDGLD